MAIRDVKDYYLTMLTQLIVAKADLADFELEVKNKNITEDRLTDVKNEIAQMQINVDRLGYIIYLLELPKRTSKQPKFNKTHKELIDKFTAANATRACVETENDSLLALIHKALTELTTDKKDEELVDETNSKE